jgi:hypothetical protein
MSNPRFKSGGTSSSLTEYRKTRMIYANYLIQQQNQTSGCKLNVNLESGGVAEAKIIPILKNGTLYITEQERDAILASGACPTSASEPQIPATILFTTIGSTSWTAPSWVTSVEYLLVGGGGGSGGGYDTGAGGGGGGGMVLTGTLSITPGATYTITVGDGGNAGTVDRTVPLETNGGSGEDSTFASITALGGGGGFGSRLPAPGGNDGSGGPAAVNPSTASLGGRGGGSNGGGGGGGGSSGAGGNKSLTTAGEGGAGTASSLSGSSVNYGVGGNGGTGASNNNAVAGTSNRGNGARGGGGAAGSQRQGAKGGSGIVVIKY